MKIAFLNMLASAELGATGLRTAVLELARGLRKRGHEVTVLTSGTPTTYLHRGVTFVQLGRLSPFASWFDLLNPRYVYSRLRYMVRAWRHVRQARPDLLEVSEAGFEQLLLNYRRPCPIVVRLHGNVSYTIKRTLGSRMLEKVEALLTRRADAIYSPSRGYAEMIARDYRIDPDRIRIIPYGIDASALHALSEGHESLRGRLGLGDRKIVLFAGTLTDRKGAPVLIEAASAMREREDVVFVLAGRLDAKDKDLEFPPNVIARGESDPVELCQLYREASVFLMPSHFDNLSMSIVEALVFGLPVLAFAVGGNSELVHDGENGFLVDPSDWSRIPLLLSTLLDDPEKLKRFGQESSRLAVGFDLHRRAAEVEAFLLEVVGEQR